MRPSVLIRGWEPPLQLMSPVTQRAAQHRGIREAPPRSTRGAPGEERGAQEAGEGAALQQGGDGDGDWLDPGAGPELWLRGRRGLRGAGSRLGVGVGRGGASLLPAGTRRPGHTWPASSQGRVRPPRLPPPPPRVSPTPGAALPNLPLRPAPPKPEQQRGAGTWRPDLLWAPRPCGTCSGTRRPARPQWPTFLGDPPRCQGRK